MRSVDEVYLILLSWSKKLRDLQKLMTFIWLNRVIGNGGGRWELSWFFWSIIFNISMENYFTFTTLLGLRGEGGNLPLFKDAKTKRFQSLQRIVDLLEVAAQTRPTIPSTITTLNPLDRKLPSTQPNGTIRCLSPWSTDLATGAMPVVWLLCWYFLVDLVLLLLQLQRLFSQHPLQNL